MRRAGACVVPCFVAVVRSLAGAPQTTVLSTPVIASGAPVYGQTLTVVTKLSPFTPASDPAQNGMVVFSVDGHSTTPTPLDPTGAAAISLSFLPGPHTIAAQFSGSNLFLPASSATLVFQASKATPGVTISAPPAQIGQPVTIRAAVSLPVGSSGTPGGQVDFMNSGSAIASCTGVKIQSGAAICNTSFPQTGFYTITATYTGDSNTNPATGTFFVSVGKLAPSLYVARTPSAPVYGDSVTIGTLALGPQGGPTPTGIVRIFWGPGSFPVTL